MLEQALSQLLASVRLSESASSCVCSAEPLIKMSEYCWAHGVSVRTRKASTGIIGPLQESEPISASTRIFLRSSGLAIGSSAILGARLVCILCCGGACLALGGGRRQDLLHGVWQGSNLVRYDTFPGWLRLGWLKTPYTLY